MSVQWNSFDVSSHKTYAESSCSQTLQPMYTLWLGIGCSCTYFDRRPSCGTTCNRMLVKHQLLSLYAYCSCSTCCSAVSAIVQCLSKHMHAPVTMQCQLQHTLSICLPPFPERHSMPKYTFSLMCPSAMQIIQFKASR